MLRVAWHAETLELSSERVLHWPRRRTLVAADLHFGKDGVFRSAGIPVPSGTTARDLDRLDRSIDATSPERLVLLGDLFHARSGRTDALHAELAAWRARRRTLEVVLVRGNHDLHAGPPPEEWGFVDAGERFVDPPFTFAHDVEGEPATPTFAGHVHPGVRLFDAHGRKTSRPLVAPCFLFGPRRALLPAFGGMTGVWTIRPKKEERVFAVGPAEVVEVTRG